MAIEATPIVHTFTFVDAGQKKFTVRLRTTGTSLATTEALMLNGAAALQSLTNLTLVGYSLSLAYVEQGSFVGAGEGEKKAAISVKLVRTDPVYSPGQTDFGEIFIPGPVDGLFAGPEGTTLYDLVDPTDTALQSFLALFEAGLGVLPSYSLSDFQTIQDPAVSGNVKGKRITRSSRSG